jgi:cyanophycinase
VDVFLVGGGWSDAAAHDMFGGFVVAAAAHAPRRPPRVLLVVRGVDDEAREYHERFVRVLGRVGVSDLRVERVAEGSGLDPAVLEGIDGLVVGGGAMPAYHAALEPAYPRIRELVRGGLPYAGFSAGAAIAAATAIIGGWLVDGVPVCPEESNEDLAPVTVVEGLGLVEGAVDVHAAQWGNVSRLVAAVEAGLVPSGVALDECTTLLPDGDVAGAGRVWRVEPGSDGVVVTRTR